MYSIDVDHEHRVVLAQVSGFFTAAEVVAFARDEQAAAAALASEGPFGLLLEASGAAAQAQEVVSDFRALFRDLPIKAARIAIVVESALLRLQLRRMVDPARTRVFGPGEAAMAWLDESLADVGQRSRVGA